jgi:hydrogenase/urease accessory protein HupE
MGLLRSLYSFPWPSALILALLLLACPSAHAHLLIENAMDVVVSKESVAVEVRISFDELTLIESHGVIPQTPDDWLPLIAAHRAYVLAHLRLQADGHALTALPAADGAPPGEMMDNNDGTQMAVYKFAFPLASPPAQLRIEQNFLIEYEPSDATFVVRIRRNDDPQYKITELSRDSHADFNCHWNGADSSNVAATGTHIDFWQTSSAFLKQGIWHILTGYDHLLFVSALVLATNSIWDLIKVVASFTLAHTITLTLCVFNIVNLSSRVVEPMISASIMLVALQNIFYPRQSTGWARMAIAFGFGLFHGLGFAGGLKDAMSELPSMALWVSLISFSVGVEIGHQLVVLPLYAILRQTFRNRSAAGKPPIHAVIQKYGSCVICAAGSYFLFYALRGGE